MKNIITGILCLFFLLPADLIAQNRNDALRFVTQYPVLDPANAGISGASSAAFFDYGSVLRNPATLGLARESSVSFGIGLRDVEEEATFLNRRRAYDDTQFGITNATYVYRFPTVQGSLVMGGGYNQIMNFNRAFRINGYNTRSSITDFFFDNPFYFQTAFDAFAIEEDDFGQFPVLRPDFDSPFAGIDQTANQFERGQMGEFTISVASEVVQNLFAGITLGIPVGTYSYKLDFLERDTQNVHGDLSTIIGGESFVIPGIDNILWTDRIDADITGFSARAGLVYQALPNLSFGVSYAIPTRYRVEESYSVFIRTTYENGTSESARMIGDTSYQIRTPSRLNVGVSTHGLPINLSATVERVGNSRIEFRNFGDLGSEIELNEEIRDDFRTAFNYHIGAVLAISDVIQPSFGYSYLAGVSRANDNPVQFITGGLRIGMNQGFTINLGLQYNMFDDSQILYDFYDYTADNGSFLNETVSSSISRYHFMAGISVRF